MNSVSRKLVFILICIITFMIPLEELLVVPGFNTSIFIAAAVALVLSLFVVARGSALRRIPAVLIILGVFVAWCVVSLSWTVDTDATRTIVITYLSLLVFAWMIVEFVESRHHFSWILRSYWAGCCVSLAMLFISYFEGRSILVSDYARYTGGGINGNAFALLMDIAIIISVYLAANTASKWQYTYWTFVPLASLGVLLTGSRAGTLGLILAIFLTVPIAVYRKWKYIVLILLAGGCAVWLAGTFVPMGLLERITEGTEAHTFVVRTVQWNAGLESWRDAPITGVGAGAFITAVTSKGGFALVAHNTFVEILVTNGLVGCGLMLIVWVLLTRVILRLPRQEKLLWLGIGGVWLLVSMSISFEYQKLTWFLYAWIMVQSAVHHAGREGEDQA